MGKTVTSVHSDFQMLAQRRGASFRDKNSLNALSVFAQLCVGFSLYLYGRVSTPGYLSVLLSAPVVPLLFLPGWFLSRRKKPGLSVLASAAGKKGAKVYFLCFFALHLLDAQLAFFALCAVVKDVMPDFSPTFAALAAAVFCFLGGDIRESLPRLARFLKWLIGLMLFYCLAIAVPYGRIAHFFPLLGYGPASILQGALWISGASASCVWPLLARAEDDQPAGFFPVLLSPLAAVGWGTVTYLAAVWLMPVYAMQRPQSLGWRMLLLVHMTPSVPAWSMAVIGLTLLLLTALSYSVSQAAFALSQFGGSQKTPRFLYAALFMLPIPACVLDPDAAQAALAAAASWRSLAYFTLLCLLCLRCAIRNRKKRSGREEAG